VIKRKLDASSQIEKSFLLLKLGAERDNVMFTDPLHNVQKELVKLIDEIIKQSQNLPRPENIIGGRSEKNHLWDVSLDDELAKYAVKEVEEILEGNLNVVEKVLAVYDDYLFILVIQSKTQN